MKRATSLTFEKRVVPTRVTLSLGSFFEEREEIQRWEKRKTKRENHGPVQIFAFMPRAGSFAATPSSGWLTRKGKIHEGERLLGIR